MSSESQNKATVRFKNSPIIEAVIAVTIAELPESAEAAFKELAQDLAQEGYTLTAPVFNNEFLVQIESGVSAVQGKDATVGHRFNSEDGLHAVQFNRTGFVVSRLGNYDSWETFTSEARMLWSYYTRVAGLAILLEFPVRYVNKIFIPNGREPQEFLNTYIRVPENKDATQPILQDYFLRFATPLDTPQGRLVHQQVFIPPEREGFSTLILDNDFHFTALNLTIETLWNAIDQVREIKDRYFLAFITNKMKDSLNA